MSGPSAGGEGRAPLSIDARQALAFMRLALGTGCGIRLAPKNKIVRELEAHGLVRMAHMNAHAGRGLGGKPKAHVIPRDMGRWRLIKDQYEGDRPRGLQVDEGRVPWLGPAHDIVWVITEKGTRFGQE